MAERDAGVGRVRVQACGVIPENAAVGRRARNWHGGCLVYLAATGAVRAPQQKESEQHAPTLER